MLSVITLSVAFYSFLCCIVLMLSVIMLCVVVPSLTYGDMKIILTEGGYNLLY